MMKDKVLAKGKDWWIWGDPSRVKKADIVEIKKQVEARWGPEMFEDAQRQGDFFVDRAA